jgi:hypothetical protein
VIHADNARLYVAKRVKQYLEYNNLKSVPHPPYSPDRSKGQNSRLQKTFLMVRILADIPLETLITTFHEWLQRLQACIDGDGEYVE